MALYLFAYLCCLICVVLEGQCKERESLKEYHQQEPHLSSWKNPCHRGWSTATRASHSPLPKLLSYGKQITRKKCWGLRGALTLCWIWVITHTYRMLDGTTEFSRVDTNLASPRGIPSLRAPSIYSLGTLCFHLWHLLNLSNAYIYCLHMSYLHSKGHTK